MGQELLPHSSAASVQDFVGDVIASLVDGAVHRVDLAIYNQLALHQIYRSGGSELFWHEMMTSCGSGLFGGMTDLSFDTKSKFLVAFSLLFVEGGLLASNERCKKQTCSFQGTCRARFSVWSIF